MTIAIGDQLPAAAFLRMGDSGPEEIDLMSRLKGRKVILFGFVGAYTGTCAEAHIPSFIRNRDAFSAKGVEEIIGIAVNDPFVMDAFTKVTGADEGGVTLVTDPASTFSKAIGLTTTAEQVGLFDRSKRYAMLVEDGTVKVLHVEDNPGVCTVSGGDTFLDAI